MYFSAAAELELGISTATGKPPVGGTAFVFTPEHIVSGLSSLNEDWLDTVPGASFWEARVADASWFGAFAATEGEHVQTAPPSEGEAVALILEGVRYPGTIISNADGTEARQFERYLILGQGEVPAPPAEIVDGAAT